jgi:multidrug resistance efflux pump
LDLTARGDAELQAALRQLDWGTGWLEVFAKRQMATAEPGTKERLQAVLDLMASTLGQDRFFGASGAFATSLATRLGCDRVSVGFMNRGRAQLRAMSHTAHFGQRADLVRGIEAAMDEAIDQQATVAVPASASDAPRITRAHEGLAARHGSGAICTVPLVDGDRMIGAMVLERIRVQPFDASTLELAEAAANLVGPILELRRRDDRWLGAKVFHSMRQGLAHLLGPQHVGLKLAAFAVAALATFLAVAQGDYRVAARTVMEAAERHAAVAPVSGYIREAPARAGDVVRRGQLLAALDDRELRLERARWSSQLEQFAKQQSAALAVRHAAQASIAGAQIEQARAQLMLAEDQLARMQVITGFDGVVVTGDLSQSIGSPVERGQVLFEIAPLTSYRVALQVDERDVSDVRVGQRGRLLLAAAPAQPLPFTVEKITPVSTAKEGRNFFRVEASLDQGAERVRPGMEGVAKIEVGRRHLVAIWLRPVIDWARLALWTWLP